MPKPKSFVLNDETKTNSHGFRVRNSGIDLSRFLANPIMLDYHRPGNDSVIGKWVNLRIEGSLLLADPEFDEEDPDAKKIAGKVDRGFIKGASMGLGVSNAKWEMVDDVPTLIACELTEASIASIPSNANALRLYAETGDMLQEKDIKLSISSISNSIKQLNMNNIKLSVATKLALGIENTDDTAELGKAIDKLATDSAAKDVQLATKTSALEALELKLTAIADAEAETIVEAAVKAGKITADKKDYFLSLAKNDLPMVEGLLSAIPAKVDLAGNVITPAGGAAPVAKTMDEFEKLTHEQKLAFKQDSPEAYKALFNV